METFYGLASTRRSIRKYTQDDVDIATILECVDTAVTAPSGCDSQCWKFVVVHDRAVIDRLAEAVAAEFRAFAETLGLAADETYMESKIKMLTFFRNAPACVAVYMTNMDYYDTKMLAALTAHGYSHDDVMRLYGEPDVLSLGAAIQNFLLAAHERGLGACWMNDPVVAKKSIGEILGAAPGERLLSLIPVGHPAYTPRAKKYRPMDEILKVID